jgi:hypothetical protein
MTRKARKSEGITTAIGIKEVIDRLKAELAEILARIPQTRAAFTEALVDQALGAEHQPVGLHEGSLAELHAAARRISHTLRGLKARHKKVAEAEAQAARARRKVAEEKRLEELLAQLDSSTEFSRDLETEIRLLAASVGKRFEMERTIQDARDRRYR